MAFRQKMSPRWVCFLAFAAVTVVAFYGPLAALARLAWTSRLHSHALLVPAISAWIVLRHCGPLPPLRTSPMAAVGLLLAAAALVAGVSCSACVQSDRLVLHTLALLLTLYGAWMACLGWPVFKSLLFPLLFLVFVVPLPSVAVHALSVLLQDGSAWLSHATFAAMGWPIYREGYTLVLPGLSLEVAEECSGINSTYALFITSVLAGWLLLKSHRNRALFIGAVLPLGLLRNTFRIVTLAVLTLKVDARVLDSPLHHRGGPIFFALSLAPLFGWLVWLHRLERRHAAGRKEPEVS